MSRSSPAISLCRARTSSLCSRMGGGLVDPEEAVGLVASRLGDLDASGLEAACKDAVSELLVRLVQEGGTLRHRGRNALASLWIREVTRWCRGMCHSSQPALDLAQEVLVALIVGADSIRDPSQLRRWLHSVAWRKIRDNRRLAWFKRRVHVEPDRTWADPTMSNHDDMDLVGRVLDGVSAESRRLLWLVYAEGYSRREVAQTLDMAEGTLNRKLTKARRDFERVAARLGLDEAEALRPGGTP